MSKREITARQNAIVNKLSKCPATLKEINQHLLNESELQEYKLTVSDRTFQRDRQDILSLYNISIECDKPRNRYYIADSDESVINNRMLEAFNTFHALNSSIGMSDYLEFEKYPSSGSENLYGIMHAVKNRLQLNITYQSYWDEVGKVRSINPYFLKEFKNRWYLIALDNSKDSLRTYALDRIKSFDISKKKFVYPTKERPKSYFDNCFGIVAPENSDPLEPVILSFTTFQGKFIKSLPLHPSQTILIEDEQEDKLIIKLDVFPTFDLVMQVLSYGENVEVIEPRRLRDEIKTRLKNSLAKYDD